MSTHMHTHTKFAYSCVILFLRLAVVLFVKQHECQHIHLYFHLSVFFFLPLVKSVQSIPRQTHTYALFVKVEKVFFV